MPQAVAIWVANAVVAVGTAATAATGVAAFTSAAVAIGTGTIALSGALGLGAAVTAWTTVGLVVSLASKPKIPQASGGQVSVKMDPQAPIPIALGRTATGGYVIYRAGFGNKNQHLGIITALSTGPIQAIENFYANDILCTFTNTSSGPTTTSGQWTNKMRQYQLLGNTSDAAYDLPVPPYQAELPGWTSAHKTTGFATSLWINQFDAGRYPTGLPRGLWVLQGEKFYDPRQDSTYPGGSGGHRLANSATWTYTENPFVMALGWILGRFHNGKKVWGCGVSASGIDWSAYVDGANVADANAWKAGGVVTTAEDKWAVLTTILQAGGGVPVARGGQISCMVSTPKASVYSITATDVIGEVSIQTSLPRRNRINKIVPKYRSEANRWQIVAADAVTNAAYLAEDASEVRSKEVEYSLVQQVNQAAQLAAYDLCNAREGLTMTVTCKPRLLNVRVCEVVTITLDELGLSGQKCTVLGRTFDPATLQVSLTLRSETDAKHSFALGRTGVAPPSPSLTAYDPSSVAAPAIGVWTATGGTVGNGAVSQPAILVAGASDDVNAQSVIVEYRPASSPTYRLWAEGPASTTNFEITGVSATTSYVVAVSYRSIRGVVGGRVELPAVTTGALSAGLVGGLGPADVNNALITPPAVNRVRYSRWEAGSGTGWQKYDPSGVISNTYVSWPATVTGVQLLQMTGTATAAGQTFGIFGGGGEFAVTPGERLSVQGRIEMANGPGDFALSFFDAGFNWLAEGSAFTPLTSNPNLQTRQAGFVVVPSGAVTARLNIGGFTQAAGPIKLTLAQPMVTAVTASQTSHPAWVPGPDSAPGADVTIQNLPINLQIGSGYTFSPAKPITSATGSSLTLAATVVSTTVGTYSLPAATISGLAASTSYAVFWDRQSNAFLAVTAGLTTYFTSLTRYLYVSSGYTAASGGTGTGGGSVAGLEPWAAQYAAWNPGDFIIGFY